MKLKSGEVVMDRFNSHLHNGVARFLPDALTRIDSQGRGFFVEEVVFDHPIGETTCVATAADDQIVYAQRPRRGGLTRFALNRAAQPCSSLVVILKAGGCGEYIIVTAFIGHRPEPEPWDHRNFSQQVDPAEAERRSREFWSSHALVWGSEEIIPGTETTRCPW